MSLENTVHKNSIALQAMPGMAWHCSMHVAQPKLYNPRHP